MSRTADILMITYNRPSYTQQSLKRLLDTCDASARVWVWHNGMDTKTLEVVHSFTGHPRMYRFYHSEENVKLLEPTNWLWRESEGEYLGKVDDDCLVPSGWAETLVAAHEENAKLGVIGCWHFMPEDVDHSEVQERIMAFAEHQLLRNCWIGGSGYLMKRCAQERQGFLKEGQSWPNYVLNLSARGWINGWYYPFLYQEHMDDPRSANTRLRTDSDVLNLSGLTARQRGVVSVDDLIARQREAVREILTSSLDPRDYIGWRARRHRLCKQISKLMGWA